MFLDGLPVQTAIHIGWTTLAVGTLTLAVGAGTLAKGVLEYKRQNSLKRFEKYQELKKFFDSDPSLQKLREAVQQGGNVLADYPTGDKYRFMSFYEDVALMCQSGLMRMEVAAYLIGYDAREVARSRELFAHNLYGKEDDPNLALFWDFLDRLDQYSRQYYPQKGCPAPPYGGPERWPVREFRF